MQFGLFGWTGDTKLNPRVLKILGMGLKCGGPLLPGKLLTRKSEGLDNSIKNASRVMGVYAEQAHGSAIAMFW